MKINDSWYPKGKYGMLIENLYFKFYIYKEFIYISIQTFLGQYGCIDLDEK